MSDDIRELISAGDLRAAFPVMRQLRTHLSEDEFVATVGAMRPEGYRLLALFNEGRAVALAGVAVLTNLYHGRHVWVYDLVTDEAARSRGHGARLLAWVEGFAREQGCARVALSSGVQRVDAHRFYERKMGYARASYVFTKNL